LLPVYAHYLGSEGYGIIGMIDVVVSFLTVCIGWGLTGGMQRFYYTKKSDSEKATLVSTGVMLMFLWVIIISVLPLVLSKPIANAVLGDIENGWYYISLAILTFSADMTAGSASCYILIQQKSKLYSTLSFGRFFIGLMLNIYFVVYLRMNVIGVLYGNLITSVLFSAIFHIYTLRRVGINYSKHDANVLLRYSLPLLPGSLAMLVRNDIDKLIIRTFMGLSSLGAYVMLMKFSSLITILILEPFNNIWNVKRFEVCETKDGPFIMARIFTLELTLMLFLGLILALEIPLILKVIAPKEFWVPGYFAFFAIISRILFSCYYNVVFGLAYAKLTRNISMIQITTAALSVVFNYLSIKYFGLIGALASACAVYLIQCILAYYMSDKYYHIPFEWGNIIKLVGITIILFVVIDSFSIIHLGLLATPTEEQLRQMNSTILLKSKIIMHILQNIPVIVDALLKLVLSLSFLIAIILMKVVMKEDVYRPFNVIIHKLAFRKANA